MLTSRVRGLARWAAPDDGADFESRLSALRGTNNSGLCLAYQDDRTNPSSQGGTVQPFSQLSVRTRWSANAVVVIVLAGVALWLPDVRAAPVLAGDSRAGVASYKIVGFLGTQSHSAAAGSGALDPTFGVGGKVTTDFAGIGNHDTAAAHWCCQAAG
jgi:hypothetical protein